MWDEIIYPFPNSTVQPLKFGNGKINSSHTITLSILILKLFHVKGAPDATTEIFREKSQYYYDCWIHGPFHENLL